MTMYPFTSGQRQPLAARNAPQSSDCRISVIVPTLNRHEILGDTLRQVFSQRLQEFELIVLDQSDPQLALEQRKRLRQEFPDPRLHYVMLDRRGLPNARNEGLARARAPIVLFLDDDVILLSRDFLSAHLEAYADPQVGGVCGRVIERRNAPNSRRTGSRISWGGRTIENLLGNHPCQIHSLKGANMSFRAAVFDAGGFDRSYIGTALLEEADMAWRIARRGWRLVFEPRAELLHLSAEGGGVREGHELDTEYWRFRSTAYFVRKNRGLPGVPPFLLTFGLIAAKRFVRWPSPGTLTTLWRATRDGFQAARNPPQDSIPSFAGCAKPLANVAD